jgi:glycosyltransferase involved in cell wall biosynthesis
LRESPLRVIPDEELEGANSLICHFITSEYPPQPGGVSDYTRVIAAGLGAIGDQVHVWCPNAKGETPRASGVWVHRDLGDLSPSDLRRAGRLLDRFDGPRRLVVQWVPHGYGHRAMNLPFCLWLWSRARRHGDRIELIVHEPFLSFGEGTWRQNCVAVVQRLMTVVLLNAASRVWTTIPAWEKRLRPYALGRRSLFHWLPVVSNIPIIDDPTSVNLIRSRYAGAGGESPIVGHFGTYDRNTAELLLSSIPVLVQNGRKPAVMLLGRGSTTMRDQLIREYPGIAYDVHATGELDADDLSLHLGACDLMFQPYIDGVSSRRTTIMAQLSLGLPVITTAGDLTEPLWAESRAVALTPAGDVSKMVDATNRLLGDEGERKRLALAARSLYLNMFDIGHTVAALRAQPLTHGSK